MTRPSLAIGFAVVAATMAGPVGTRADRAPQTADELVARVLEVHKERGFRIHATLTRSTPGSDAKDVRTLLITGRRTKTSTTMLYRQMWPAVRDGRALVIDDPGDHQLHGFRYDTGQVTTLTNAALGWRVFDSDLLVEDLAELFWRWPSHTIAGREPVGEHTCAIVDFRPGPSTATTYSRVRVWVSPDLAIGLRAEMFGRDGRLVKRVGLFRVLKFADRWMPAIVTVEPVDGRSRTVLEGVKLEQDVPVSPADFTVRAIRGAGRGT